MHFLDLPEEILLQIISNEQEHDTLTASHYLNLLLASKRLQNLVTPMLYRKLDIKLGSYIDQSVGASNRFARGRLLTEPGLGNLVQHLSIECVHGQVKHGLEATINCLKVTPNIQELTLGYDIAERGPGFDDCILLLRSGTFRQLKSLTVSSSLCGCRMLPLFMIPTVKHLHFGYYSSMQQELCSGNHDQLLNPDPTTLGSSSVEDLSISMWQPGEALKTLIKLPKKLVHFSGTWKPWDNPYSAISVSEIFSVHESTLKTMEIGASLDKDDEYDPQESDGTLALFADYSALKELRCHVDVLLGEDFNGTSSRSALADRLPSQLEKLQIYYVPRIVSAHAHKPDTDMEALDSCLVWVRSLSRAKHERSTALRCVTFNETTYLPGPMNGPYLSPKFSQMQWKEDEQTAWSERGPYPLKAVGLNLRVWLVFVVRGWTLREPHRRRHIQELEEAANEAAADGDSAGESNLRRLIDRQ